MATVELNSSAGPSDVENILRVMHTLLTKDGNVKGLLIVILPEDAASHGMKAIIYGKCTIDFFCDSTYAILQGKLKRCVRTLESYMFVVCPRMLGIQLIIICSILLIKYWRY